jgi:hypothetical protein
MSGKAKKLAKAKSQSARKSTKNSQKARRGSQAAEPAADSQFVKGLLTRGEAAKLDPDGKLPLQATHIIDSENKDGSVGVRRARFKLF